MMLHHNYCAPFSSSLTINVCQSKNRPAARQDIHTEKETVAWQDIFNQRTQKSQNKTFNQRMQLSQNKTFNQRTQKSQNKTFNQRMQLSQSKTFNQRMQLSQSKTFNQRELHRHLSNEWRKSEISPHSAQWAKICCVQFVGCYRECREILYQTLFSYSQI